MESLVERKECKKCKKIFSYTPEDTWWDEHGYGYSTKLCRCTECGCVNIINYSDHVGFDVNRDLRFYTYNTKQNNK